MQLEKQDVYEFFISGVEKMMMNFFLVERKNDDEFFFSVEEKKARRSRAKKSREVDWKEAGEERSDERAWILSDSISGTSDSEELLVLSVICYIINNDLNFCRRIF